MKDFNIRKGDMPDEMQTLLAEYPRDNWASHPGFDEKTKHWLGAHRFFRQLAYSVGRDVERYLDHDSDDHDFAASLSYRGRALVQNLHGHHGWEDHEFFPELSAADPRFVAGLDILETDHAELDHVLDGFTSHANRTLQLIQMAPADARNEAGKLHDHARAIRAFLDRHLTDEEELAVPIILHHRLRG